ncbi:MAG: electron transfer flavoprotein subunit beta/FixA family protein [Anaerolineae bacterium]
MRIVVILGRVLDPRGIVVNPRAGRVFVNREEYILQPADRCALEAALRIKETVGAEVVALPRAFLPDDDILRQALAIGADRAIYLAGKPTALPDDGLMARVLVAAIGRLGGADLILTGATTLDTGQGQLGPRLAEALGWPQIVGAWAAEVADGVVRTVRQDDAGFVQVEAPLPAVVTFVPGALKLRYPDGRRLINIYKGVGDIAAALERWEAKDLVAPEALTPVLERRGQDFPPERERGVRLTGSGEEMARSAADALRARLVR